MTKKQFAALARVLEPRLEGFEVKAPLMLSVPLNRILRGICFENSSDARAFYVWVFFLPLYIPRQYISFEFGHRIRRSTGEQCWNADAKDLHQELARAIEQDALPFLSPVSAPSDVGRAASALLNPSNPHYHEALAFSLARAEQFADAKTALDLLLQQIDPTVSWQSEIADRALKLKELLLDDPQKAQRQLEEWERHSIQNLGLEKFRSTEV